jgi:hypothetical protein
MSARSTGEFLSVHTEEPRCFLRGVPTFDLATKPLLHPASLSQQIGSPVPRCRNTRPQIAGRTNNVNAVEVWIE